MKLGRSVVQVVGAVGMATGAAGAVVPVEGVPTKIRPPFEHERKRLKAKRGGMLVGRNSNLIEIL